MIIKESQRGLEMASPHRHRIRPGAEVKLVSGGGGFRRSADVASPSSQETQVSQFTKQQTHKTKRN